MGEGAGKAAWPLTVAIPDSRDRFELKNKQSVVDALTSATLTVRATGDLDFLTTEFQMGDFKLRGALKLAPKFSDRPVVAGSPSNPSIMIMAGDWELGFRDKNMRDRDLNSRLVRYIVRMLAFMGKARWNGQYFWSNDGRGSENFKSRTSLTLFTIPSDDELIAISDSA